MNSGKRPVANGLARTARDSTEDRKQTTDYQRGANAGSAGEDADREPRFEEDRQNRHDRAIRQQDAPDEKFRWREPSSISHVRVELLAVPEDEGGLGDGAESV